MFNEKGMILPTTLIVMFLLSSFVTFQINQYVIEKRLIKEEGDLYTAERLLQLGVVDVSKMLFTDSRDNFSGELSYEEGNVTFVVKKESNDIKSVHLISKTVEQKSKQMTFFYYENDETVLPWLEVR